MAHRGHGDGIHLGNNSAADFEPIPLQDLSSTTGQAISPTPSHSQQHDPGADSWGVAYANTNQHTHHSQQQRSRARSIVQAGVGIGRRLSTSVRTSYDRVHDHTPSNIDGRNPFDADADLEPELAGSSAQLQQGFEEAIGLSSDGRPRRGSWLPPRNLDDATPPYLMHSDYDDPSVRVGSIEIREVDEDDDRAGLTIPENIQPMSGSNLTTPVSPFGGRGSRFGSPSARLGDDLEQGMGGTSGASSINSRGSLSVPSASPVRRLSIAVQRMSERVVNLGNDATVSVSRKASQTSIRGRSISIRSPSTHRHVEFDDYAKEEIQSPDEKPTTPLRPKHPSLRKAPPGRYNPLKGKTLGIFGPNNKLRLFLCDVICHPFTEPLILLMIIIQLVFLTVDSAPSVFEDPRSKAWGTSAFDYALLVLFIFYTLEIIARSIVSGFLFNSHDPSENKSLSQTFERKAKMLFSLGKTQPPREDKPSDFEQPSLLRSVTNLQSMGKHPDAANEGLVMNRLARRAFLRHSFNRLDFVAVVSYWISLVLFISGVEAEKHIYVFRMMSSLRILRLVGITSGTSVILRSLKKAAPLLANVALLIGFFWMVFGIVGVQSFKSSLRRRCVWQDPEGIQPDFKHEFQFCGGYLDNITFQAMPWIYPDGRQGTKSPKGYLCPVQSKCILDDNPYSGTVSFDNIFQSLELVFVIMSSNTFSDLIYYTADSDYLIASMFFIVGVVILAFWLVNLLVAVITTSFQIIREESKKRSAFTENEQEHNLEEEEDEQFRIRPTTIQKWYGKTFWVWIFVIVVGLVASMFRSATMSVFREQRIINAEFATTILLDVEMVLRFTVNWRRFHKSKRNLVDLMIAVMSTILLLPPVRNSPAYGWLSIFAILRVYRVVWAVPSTRHLLAKVLGNVSGLFNLLFFVLLLTYLCAIFAAQLVRGDLPQFTDDGDINPNSFYTIWYSFLGMYQVFSSEGWTNILYEVQAEQRDFGVGWISATFFIGWFILANFIVLNMFIAVIQENFDVSEDEKRMYQVKAFLQRKEIGVQKNFSLQELFGRPSARKNAAESHKQAFGLLTKGDVVNSFLDDQEPRAVARSQPLAHVAESEAKGDLPPWKRWFARLWGRKAKEPNPFYTDAAPRSYGDLALTAMAQEVLVAQEKQKRLQREYLLKYPRYNTSLFIFGPDNPIRKLCQKMVYPSRGHIRFQGAVPATALWMPFSAVVYSAIIAMVVLACVTTPLYQKEYFEKHEFKITNWFVLTDAGFAGLFTLEVVVKVIADGLISTPNAYLRSAWGVIDSIVLITLWISVISSLRNQSDVSRSVGAFKALRALRLLNISGSARDIFQSVILKGGRKIISAALVSLALIIPFAIYGVNLFAGKMDACNDTGSGFTELTECLGEYRSTPFNWEVLAPRVVDSPSMNFDNFGSSLFTLFQIVSQEGWTSLSWSAQMIVGKGKQPIAQSSPANALFFVAYNLLGAVFVLTLFVSVFMRNYTEQTGVAFLTSEQRSWMELRKLLRQIRPSKRPPVSPNETWKSWCYRKATNKRGAWARFMTCILILHTLLLVVETYPAPELLDQVRDFFFLAFTLVYLANIVVRIIGLSSRQFLRSRWDVFGLFSVSGTFISTVLSVADNENAVLSRVQKLFLVSIVFMIIPRNDQLDHLFKTAAASLGTIGSLIATWFVLFLVYSIALTQTFGLTKIGPNSNGNLNFRTVPKAMIVLFRMSCGEGWNDIMTDFELKEPYCIKSSEFLDSDCGSEGYARALFISWNIISMYIFVSLFVSLIFESFSYVYERSGDLSIVTREELRTFKAAWLPFDPDGTGYIPVEKFPRLLQRLSGVFSMSIYDDKFNIKRIMEECRSDRIGPGIVSGIDLDKLNRHLSEMPIRECQERRHRFNLFYEEVMVMADRELGVSFTSVLLILAHHKIIDDHKSLKLDEFLRRRWRMQRVEDQVKRNTVTDFFLTIYWNKRFKDHQARKAAGLSFQDSFNVVDPLSPSVPRVFTGPAANSNPFPNTNPFRTRAESETGGPPNPNVPQIHIENPDTPTGSTINVSYDGTRTPPPISPASVRSNPFDSRAGSPTKGHKKNQLSIGSLASPEVSPPGSRFQSRSASPAQSLGESKPGSPYRSRAGSHVSAQEVVEEALQGSEWAKQIRSVVSQLSPSSGVFPALSGMPGGSRSDSRASNRSNKSTKSTKSRSGSKERGRSRPGSPKP